MQEQNVSIKEVIEAYAALKLSDKRRELGREISEMTIIIQNILNEITSQEIFTPEILKEFDNLYDGTVSEDKYLTGLYEDILNFKELLGICIDKLS